MIQKSEKCNSKDPSKHSKQMLDENVVFQATVKMQGCEDEKYVGLTARPFKTRYINKTNFVAHMEKLKEAGKTPYDVTWNVICKCKENMQFVHHQKMEHNL